MQPQHHLIPHPVDYASKAGGFTLTGKTVIQIAPATDEMTVLAGMLQTVLGRTCPVMTAPPSGAAGCIHLALTEDDPALGREGYALRSAPEGVRLTALWPAGIFYGIQTLRQLLPMVTGGEHEDSPWTIPACEIRDWPRFPWRGAMLDVARHFFSVSDVQRYVDLLAAYKLNRLHLHLTDDQGWRIAIAAWPRLAEYGGGSEVGGGPGGYYTQADYAAIVEYARIRYVTVVPEIDLPGHTNAALASYAELNCNDVAPARYVGAEVGFSSLCTTKELTYRFLDDVLGELAALTPGLYLHIGGDEAAATPEPDYIRFIERAQGIVEKHGKQMVGWEEVALARLRAGASIQSWTMSDRGRELTLAAAQQGAGIILSPAKHTYLDMQYSPETKLGLNWAGYVEAQDAYAWDPATIIPGLPEDSILGVESPLWTETVCTFDDITYLALPRLAGHAEIGWSSATGRAWDEFRLRLAAHGPRWDAQGLRFHRSPQVPWA